MGLEILISYIKTAGGRRRTNAWELHVYVFWTEIRKQRRGGGTGDRKMWRNDVEIYSVWRPVVTGFWWPRKIICVSDGGHGQQQ